MSSDCANSTSEDSNSRLRFRRSIPMTTSWTVSSSTVNSIRSPSSLPQLFVSFAQGVSYRHSDLSKNVSSSCFEIDFHQSVDSNNSKSMYLGTSKSSAAFFFGTSQTSHCHNAIVVLGLYILLVPIRKKNFSA